MKLLIETIELIRNFSKFQPGIIICPGNTLKVRTRAAYAEATVAESFPAEVRISNVQDFLRTVALFKDPDFDFTEDHIRIAETDGTAELVYPQAKPGSVVQLPVGKGIKPLPPEQIKFTISDDQWATLQKALGLRVVTNKDYWEKRNLVVVSDGKTVQLTADRGYKMPGYSLVVGGVTNGV